MRTCLPCAAGAEHFGLAYDVLGPAPRSKPGKCPEVDPRERQKWLEGCTGIATPKDYGIHYERWQNSFGSSTRIRVVETVSRLLIGHGNASASDVGLTVHRTWGTPVIPGTALKGLLSGYVDAVYGPDASCSDPDRCDWAAPTWGASTVEKAPGRWHAAIFGSPSVPHRIEVTVRFGEAVTVDTSGGTPTVGITMGNEQRRAMYVGGSGTTTLTFVYRVTANDRVAGKVKVVADRLECNGGKIRNASGTAATAEGMHAIVQYRGLRGGVTFHDALCIPSSRYYEPDVLTVHQKPYYDGHGSEWPNDWNAPVPVPFLTVKPGVRFLLAIEGPPNATKVAMKVLVDALREWGIGAKTAAGYGAMARDCGKEQQVRREIEERERKERKVADRAEWIVDLNSSLREKVERIFEDRQDRDDGSDIVRIINQVQRDDWSEDEKIEVAKWLQGRMRAGGHWKEKSSKKNPDKDKTYQRTLLVKDWLRNT